MATEGLLREVARYVARGYRLVQVTESSANLVRTKRTGIRGALVGTIIGFGGGAPVDSIGDSRQDEVVVLTVDDDGIVQARTIGGSRG